MKQVEVISEAQIQTEVGPRNVKLGEVFEMEEGYAEIAESLGIVKVLGDVSEAPVVEASAPAEEVQDEEVQDEEVKEVETEVDSDGEEQADPEDEAKG